MKRLPERDPGKDFFALDEAVQILLHDNPSPLLVARLLQLSKRVRLLVWDFLVNPQMGGFEWVNAFATQLSQFVDRAWPASFPCCLTYPMFLHREACNRCVLVRFLVTCEKTNIFLVLTQSDDENCSHAWTAMTREKKDLALQWYIVATAFAQRFDAIVLREESARREGFLVLPPDADLFLH